MQTHHADWQHCSDRQPPITVKKSQQTDWQYRHAICYCCHFHVIGASKCWITWYMTLWLTSLYYWTIVAIGTALSLYITLPHQQSLWHQLAYLPIFSHKIRHHKNSRFLITTFENRCCETYYFLLSSKYIFPSNEQLARSESCQNNTISAEGCKILHLVDFWSCRWLRTVPVAYNLQAAFKCF